MVIETFTIMASIAISLVLYALDRSNEPRLPKAMRKEIKLPINILVFSKKFKTDQFI